MGKRKHHHCSCEGMLRGEVNPCFICLSYAVKREHKRLEELAASAERLGYWHMVQPFREPVSVSVSEVRVALMYQLEKLRRLK